MKEKVLAMANSSADWYLKNFNVLGIEEEKDSNWFYAVGKYDNSKKITVLCVAKKDSDCKTGFMGDLNRFAIIYAMDRCGLKIKWRNDYPIWPVWYHDRDAMEKFLSVYNPLIAKYGFDRKSILKVA